MENQLRMFRAAFDGDTYSPPDDYTRLKSSLDKTRYLMTNPRGSWWTLKELADKTGSSEAGISARIRDLRKIKNGSYTIESRRLSGGLWEYRTV